MIDIVVKKKIIDVTNKSNEITLTGDDNNILVEIEQRNIKADILARQDIGINFFGIPYDILNVVYVGNMIIFESIENKLSNTLYVVKKDKSTLAIYMGAIFLKEVKMGDVGFPYTFPLIF